MSLTVDSKQDISPSEGHFWVKKVMSTILKCHSKPKWSIHSKLEINLSQDKVKTKTRREINLKSGQGWLLSQDKEQKKDYSKRGELYLVQTAMISRKNLESRLRLEEGLVKRPLKKKDLIWVKTKVFILEYHNTEFWSVLIFIFWWTVLLWLQ